MMRLVFVNHCHPDAPHVCATRVRELAAACARRGHQVVLLTETLPDSPAGEVAPERLAAALADHDWRLPFPLACRPLPRRWLVAAREGRLPGPLRRPLLAAAYLARSGVFTDWRDGSRPYWRPLVSTFRPEAVWGSFGNTDVLVIARAIAGLAGCPWVMDFKDPWSAFIPGPLRRPLARRFGDAAFLTALSAQHAADAEPWFGRTAEVVYSGIDSALLAPHPPPPSDGSRLLLVGGLYARDDLDALLAGLRSWLEDLPAEDRDRVSLAYAGGERETFRAAAAGLAGLARVEDVGYVPLADLAALAAGSVATLYVRSRTALYQHKLLELAAMGRPAICLPPESGEAMAIAGEVGATVIGCRDPGEVRAALAAVVRVPPPPPSAAALAGYGWDAQAGRLAAVLAAAAERRP
jgi:hypothetical protein